MWKAFNQKGFSLVEVLVASGLVGGLSLGLAQLMKNNNESQTQIAAKDDLRSSSQKIAATLSNPQACVNTFNPVLPGASAFTQAQTQAGVPFTQVRDKDNAVSTSVNDKYGKVSYTSFTVRNYRAASDSADLVIQVRFNKSSTVVMERSAVIPLNMVVDSTTNRIITCSAGSNESNLWAKMASPDLGIYYSAGSIKMGTGLANTDSTVPSMIMGTNNTATGENSVAMGSDNSVTNDLSMALGYNNNITGARSYVMGGYNTVQLTSEVPQMSAIAIGTSNWVSAHNTLALGTSLSVASEGSIAIGYNSTTVDDSSVGRNGIVIGTGSASTGISSFAAGTGASAVAENTFSLGTGSSAISKDAFAIGTDSIASGLNTISIGNTSKGAGDNALAIGYLANAASADAVALGRETSAYVGSIAIGKEAMANTSGAIAIGSATTTYINGGAELQQKARATGSGSIVIGAGATDAKASPNEANTAYYDVGDDGSFGANYPASGAIAIGVKSRASNLGAIAIGGLAAGAESLALGWDGRALGRGSIAIGNSYGGKIEAFGHNSMSIGINHMRTVGRGSVAIGQFLTTNHDNSMILGLGTSEGVTTQAANELLLTAPGTIRACVGANDGNNAYASRCSTFNVASGWSPPSDRTIKKNIKKIDANEVLEKLSELDISTWQYKSQKDSEKKNIGPMAQDFHRLFVVPYKLGGTDKTIAPNDVFNFGILGVQALNQKVKDLERENKELRDETSEMKAILCELKPSAKLCKK